MLRIRITDGDPDPRIRPQEDGSMSNSFSCTIDLVQCLIISICIVDFLFLFGMVSFLFGYTKQNKRFSKKSIYFNNIGRSGWKVTMVLDTRIEINSSWKGSGSGSWPTIRIQFSKKITLTRRSGVGSLAVTYSRTWNKIFRNPFVGTVILKHYLYKIQTQDIEKTYTIHRHTRQTAYIRYRNKT